MKHRSTIRGLACAAFAALGCSDAATGPTALPPRALDAELAAAEEQVTITFVSDPSWGAQYVCLGVANPVDCPAGATIYGYGGPGGWGTDLSSIPTAHWVWATGVHGSSTSYPAVYAFSKSFELPGTPTGGSIAISADDFAEISVNGALVGSIGSVSNSDDATIASTTLTTFDIGPYLATGTNVISIRAANGNFGCGSIAYSCNPGALVFGGSLTYAMGVPAAPIVTSVVLPADPIPVGTPAELLATFTDVNADDVHAGEFTWETGSVPGVIVEDGGTGTAAAGPIFAAPGVYTIAASITDGVLSGSRSSTSDMPAYLVVYDPAAGFVTGGGWILSPEGACRFAACSEATTGKATFGFTSRYEKGATVPSGTTAFRFHAGDLAFASSAYDWLVVAGARAQFKGSGSINGAGGYGFLLTAIDGEISGGGGVDRFRIKIWELAGGNVVYDNNMSLPETGDAATGLGAGSIRIHR